MGFTLDRRLWGGLPLSTSTTAAKEQPLSIALRVVWFDHGFGSFELRYAASGGCAVAFAATVGNTGRWVERTAVVQDARFDGTCGSHAPSEASRKLLAGADLLLVSTTKGRSTAAGLADNGEALGMAGDSTSRRAQSTSKAAMCSQTPCWGMVEVFMSMPARQR